MRNNLPYAKLFNICRRAWSSHHIYVQCIGIPMGTYCAHLTAGLFYFAIKVISWFLLDDNKLLKLFNSTSRHLYNLLNTDNLCIEGMMNRIYPPEL